MRETLVEIGDFDLGISGFRYSDLYRPDRLRDLAQAFYEDLAVAQPELSGKFEEYRAARGQGLTRIEESSLLIRVAAHQSRFIARLFSIEEERERSVALHGTHDPVFRFKRDLVVRRGRKKYGEGAGEDDVPDLLARGSMVEILAGPSLLTEDPERAVALAACVLLDLESAYLKTQDPKNTDPLPSSAAESMARVRESLGSPPESDGSRNLDYVRELLTIFEKWSARAYSQRRLQGMFKDWVSFQTPENMEWPDGLVKFQRPRPDLPEALETPHGTTRNRSGFKLTDNRWGLRETLDHAHYCVICHEREKDSCSKGLPLPRKDKPLQINPLGVVQAGCPLDERVSEMHLLKREGDTIAALAMVMIDNPMCPATGHRICNDCMKGCIYQKQEPVNIPQIETRVLTDVLELPWGVEIYGLMTRWNPVNVKRPYRRPYNGKNVLVVGMGPAGYSLAQYLMNEGFGIIGIDGLKIEPLPEDLVGSAERLPLAVRDFKELRDELDERVSGGFGGVAEYGITVRWDKNFLKLIALTLSRSSTFKAYGGVRFGGTIKAEDAWDMGFDHIAIAAGAGRPTVVEMKNNLIPGIRKASDFLMALQLTGAYKKFTVANLQLRLPCVVIGGGLTGIDTATEALAYYPVQVLKILERFEAMISEFGEERVWGMYNDEEKGVLKEYLDHGRRCREETKQAEEAGRLPDFASLCRKWGGVSLVYRKRLQDSPAYRSNHEEIIKALEEGITYVECMDPREAVPDSCGWVSAVRFERLAYTEEGKLRETGEFVTLPAKSVLVAAGTTPNIIYEKERPGTLELDERRRFFKGYNVTDGKLVSASQTREDPGFFTSYEKNGRFISYYGDNHPIYAGNVVKAVASARDGAPRVVALFAEEIAQLDPKDQQARDAQWQKLRSLLDDRLKVTVQDVIRLTPNIVEVVVRAPMQARQFKPGQFYRLQNYETRSLLLNGTKLQMEGIALTGAWVDKEKGLLSMIALELGLSSRLCAFLRKGEEVVAMGPTGAPSEIGQNENVVLFGGGLGNAVLFSIARATKDAGNKVLYFAGYKKPSDLFHRDDIEAACDKIIWSVDAGEPIQPRRPQDRSFVGNIVQACLAYARGELGEILFPLKCTNRILAIGSDRMMAAVKQARYGVLSEYFSHPHVAIASINSPMQCMMKEVCAQCLQKHVDPETGKTTFVFSCFNQDQKMDMVDWKNLNDRLRQNTVQEKLSNLWLDYLLKHHQVEHV